MCIMSVSNTMIMHSLGWGRARPPIGTCRGQMCVIFMALHESSVTERYIQFCHPICHVQFDSTCMRIHITDQSMLLVRDWLPNSLSYAYDAVYRPFCRGIHVPLSTEKL